MRLAALGRAGRRTPTTSASSGRCWPTCAGAPGWQTILEAARRVYRGRRRAHGCRRDAGATRDLDAAARRAGLEGGVAQAVGPSVASAAAGFADDTAPADALVAVPDGARGLGRGRVARARPGRGPSRSRGAIPPWPLRHPLAVPPGEWDLTLRTTFVEPAYLEPDASWCVPGGEPATPARQRRAPSAGRWRPRWPRWPVAWPTSTGGRSGSCCPGRTWCATGRSGPRSPAGVRGRRVRGAAGGPHAGLARASTEWVTAVSSVAPGSGRRGGGRARTAGLRRPAGRGVGRGRRAPGRARSAARAAAPGRDPDIPVTVRSPAGAAATADRRLPTGR